VDTVLHIAKSEEIKARSVVAVNRWRCGFSQESGGSPYRGRLKIWSIHFSFGACRIQLAGFVVEQWPKTKAEEILKEVKSVRSIDNKFRYHKQQPDTDRVHDNRNGPFRNESQYTGPYVSKASYVPRRSPSVRLLDSDSFPGAIMSAGGLRGSCGAARCRVDRCAVMINKGGEALVSGTRFYATDDDWTLYGRRCLSG